MADNVKLTNEVVNMFTLTSGLEEGVPDKESQSTVLPEYEIDTGLLYDPYVGYLTEEQHKIVGDMARSAKTRGLPEANIWLNEIRLARVNPIAGSYRPNEKDDYDPVGREVLAPKLSSDPKEARLAAEGLLLERSAMLDKAISEKRFEDALKIYRSLYHDYKGLVAANAQVSNDGLFGIVAARIPVQRAELRIYQAGKESDPQKKLDLLELAVSNYKNSIELLSRQDGESKIVSDELVAASQRLADISGQMSEPYKKAAKVEKDPVKKRYYEAQGFLLEGNLAAGKLALMDVRKLGTGHKDPKTTEVVNSARRKLHNLTLAALEQMVSDVESVETQRGRRLAGRGAEDQAASGIGYLLALKDLVETWQADTVDEAKAILRNPQLNKEVRSGWSVGLPLHDKEKIKAEEAAGRAFFEDYRSNNSNPALYDEKKYKDLPSMRLSGGTLNVEAGKAPKIVRVVVGKEGGTIRTFGNNGTVYTFPKSNHDRLVFILDGTVDPNGNECRQGVTPILHKYTDNGDQTVSLLLALESRAGLKQMQTKEGRGELLLKVAENGFKARLGSYEVAGKILGSLFEEDLKAEMAGIPEEEIQKIAKQVEGDRSHAEEEVERQLKAKKEDDPKGYAKLFSLGGPTTEQTVAMVTSTMERRIEERLRKVGMQRLYDKYNSMEDDDPRKKTVSARAWNVYEEMLDPLDRFGNLASETWDGIVDEAVVTAATMPITIGAGAALRVGIGATSFASKLIAEGGAKGLLARGAIFTIGSVGEGMAMEVTNAAVYGRDIDAKNIGINTALSFGFHGGGKVWKKPAAALEKAAEASTSVLRRVALKSVSTAGQLTVQTTVGTALGEVQALAFGEELPGTILERMAGHAARMVGFHYGSRVFHGLTGKVLLTAEQKLAVRQIIMTEVYRDLVANGVARDSAIQQAQNIAMRHVPDVVPKSLQKAGDDLVDVAVGPFKKAGEAIADAVSQNGGPDGLIPVAADGRTTLPVGSVKAANAQEKGPASRPMMAVANGEGVSGGGKIRVGKSDASQVVDLTTMPSKKNWLIGKSPNCDVVIEDSAVPGPQVRVSRINGSGRYNIEAIADGTEVGQGSVSQQLLSGESVQYSGGERVNVKAGGVSFEIILPSQERPVEKEAPPVVARERGIGGEHTAIIDVRGVGVVDTKAPEVPRPAVRQELGNVANLSEFRSVLKALVEEGQLPADTLKRFEQVMSGTKKIDTLPEIVRIHFKRIVDSIPEDGRKPFRINENDLVQQLTMMFDVEGLVPGMSPPIPPRPLSPSSVRQPSPPPAVRSVEAPPAPQQLRPVEQSRPIGLEMQVIDSNRRNAPRTVSLPGFDPDVEMVWTIGRHPGHTIVVNDKTVSGNHAEIRYRPGVGFEIRDLGSRNGTRVRVTDRMMAGDDLNSESPTMYFMPNIEQNVAGDWFLLSELGVEGLAAIDAGGGNITFQMPSYLQVRDFRRQQQPRDSFTHESLPLDERVMIPIQDLVAVRASELPAPRPLSERPVAAEPQLVRPRQGPINAAVTAAELALRRAGLTSDEAGSIADQIRSEFRRRQNESVYVDPDQINGIAVRLLNAANALQISGGQEARNLIQILTGDLHVGIRPGQMNTIMANGGRKGPEMAKDSEAPVRRRLEIDSDEIPVQKEVKVQNPYKADKGTPLHQRAMHDIWQRVHDKTGRGIDQDRDLVMLHHVMLAASFHSARFPEEIDQGLAVVVARGDVAGMLRELGKYPSFRPGVLKIEKVLGLVKEQEPDVLKSDDDRLKTVAIPIELPPMAKLLGNDTMTAIVRILAEKVYAKDGSDFTQEPNFGSLRKGIMRNFWGEGTEHSESAWNKLSPETRQQLSRAIERNKVGDLLDVMEQICCRDRDAFLAIREYRRFVSGLVVVK